MELGWWGFFYYLLYGCFRGLLFVKWVSDLYFKVCVTIRFICVLYKKGIFSVWELNPAFACETALTV